MSSVDVIVPCYNYGCFLRECVESVLAQSLRDVRVLIIDDASPDTTAAVAADLVRADPRVTSVRHSQNRGHIATYNEGIAWVSADYMLLLSADDYLLPGALQRAVNLMDAYPDVGFTFGRGVEVVHDAAPVGENAVLTRRCRETSAWRILPGREFIELSGPCNIVCTPTAVVRTSLQKHLGGYRPELPHSGDMEMWLRFAAHAPVGIVEAEQAVYRRHSKNMSHAYYLHGRLPDLRQRKSALDSFFEACGSVLPDAGQLRCRLFRRLARHAVGFASTAFNEGEMEAAKQLSAFAAGVYPPITKSAPWIKLGFKRIIGPTVWHILRPLADRIRRLPETNLA